jgi:hypothetical protein
MNFPPVDKSSSGPSTSLEPLREQRLVDDRPSACAALDPYAVLMLDVWPANRSRLFDPVSNAESPDAMPPTSPEELERIAAHIVTFLT